MGCHGEERDVWIGQGRFVRVGASDLSALVDEDPSLADVAADARRFADMRELDEVRYVDRADVERCGTLLEKCRYGGLVSTEEDKIIAVSFRRLRAR